MIATLLYKNSDTDTDILEHASYKINTLAPGHGTFSEATGLKRSSSSNSLQSQDVSQHNSKMPATEFVTIINNSGKVISTVSRVLPAL